ncbi:pro-epidermal growth factor-like isoform X2 [Argopecten irradians]|uniref:pro-epidermal growth factor-like isoform X2 n=1 Tax=Argopecten irradians TaxID=31199 RepID=UPI0037148CF9
MVEEAKSTPSSDRDMTHRVACVVLDECCPTEEQDEVLVELSKLAPQSLNVDSTLRLSFVLLHRLDMVKSSTEEDWEGMVEEAKSTPSSDRDMTHRVACVVLDECCPTEEQDEVLVELSKLAPQSLNVDSTLRLSFVLLHRLGGQLLIFFTSGHEVRQVIPDKKAYSGTLSWGRHMGALDVDVDRRLLYFSDLSLMKIERAGIPDDIKNGGPPRPQDLNADVTQVEGIAIDGVTKLLYWTDAGSTSPKIEQAWMTVEERSVLVFTRLSRPTGLSLDDHMDDRLYWCDSKESLIESIKLDGSDRVIVVGKVLDNPVSLDVHLYLETHYTGLPNKWAPS